MRRPEQPHELLEQELRVLEEQCSTGKVDDEADDGQNGELKKRVRSIKNCLAAKKSREQARSYVQDLEKKMSSLESQNQDLARRLAVAEAENDAIKRGWKRPPQFCTEMLQQVCTMENREGEPAALPTSLQLDAVLFLSCLVYACIHGCKLGTVDSSPFPASHPPDGVSDIPTSPTGARRSLRSLRQAGLLRCTPYTPYTWHRMIPA